MSKVWPLLFYFGLILISVVGMVCLSYILGNRHKDRTKNTIYESGMLPTGSTHIRFSTHYYMVALFFLVFDLESAFIFGWAIAAREAGWIGYAGVVVFVLMIFVFLVYEWKMGVLDWGPKPRVIQDNKKEGGLE